jgi:hypothetical protein
MGSGHGRCAQRGRAAVRAEVRAGVGRAVPRGAFVHGREVEGGVCLRARCGRASRGDAVVGRVAQLAGEGAAVTHAVRLFWKTLCTLGLECRRCCVCGLGGRLLYGLLERSQRLGQAPSGRGCWGGRRGRHGFETLDEVVVSRVVLCWRRLGHVGSHGVELRVYIVFGMGALWPRSG